MKLALLLFLTSYSAFASYSEELIQNSRRLKLHESKQWIRLMHYQPRLFGGYKSQADGMDFFLAGEEGRQNPQVEIEATINAFFSEDINEELDKKIQHPQCKFPARYLWLKKELKFDPKLLSEKKCGRFNNFYKEIGGKSVSVIFSSYYLNNPSSAFGHTFLRVNKAAQAQTGKRFELLDYGISYAALLTTNNPFIYAFASIFGLFDGSLTSMPYYYKVREYNDFESRDLWEYNLNFTQDQVDLLVAHLWELGSTNFHYYYLDENCSYVVLTFLEVANPDLTLTDRLPPVVIPADTIHAIVQENGLITDIKYRPAVRVQFAKRYSILDSDQKIEFSKIVQSEKNENIINFKNNAKFNFKQKAEILDAAMDYVDFKKNKELIDAESSASKWKQELLKTRASIQYQSIELKTEAPEHEQPQKGHRSARFGLEGGRSNEKNSFGRFQFRLALHDLLDRYDGFPEYSQIEFLSTRLRYDMKPKNLILEDFAFVRVLSLSPWVDYQRNASWKIKFGSKHIYDGSCNGCDQGDVEFGGGLTLKPFDSDVVFVPMVETGLGLSKGFTKSFYRLHAGPSFMIRISLSRNFNFSIASLKRYYFPTEKQGSLESTAEIRYAMSKDTAVNFKFFHANRVSEGALGFLIYR